MQMTIHVKDLAYAIHQYTHNQDQDENYHKAKRLLKDLETFKNMKQKTLDVPQAYMRPWPLKLYDNTEIFWLQTFDEVHSFLKEQADPAFDGCLVIPLGCIGSAKGYTNPWVDVCHDTYKDEEVYVDKVNALISLYFPRIKGLVWNDLYTTRVPRGFDEEYRLDDLPSSLTFLSLEFEGPLDLSGLLWTSIMYLCLTGQHLGTFIEECPYSFDHPYPKLKIVETPYTSHRSCDWCSVQDGDRLVSFRNV